MVTLLPAILSGAILSGALLSGTVRLWASINGSDSAAEILFAALLLPLAAATTIPLRKLDPMRRQALLEGDSLAVLILGGTTWATLSWPITAALVLPTTAWAIYRGRGNWAVILLVAAACRILGQLLGTAWVETAVAALSIAPLFLTAKSEPAAPDSLSAPFSLYQRASQGTLWAILAFASVHVLQILTPVARGANLGLLAAAALARAASDFKGIRVTPLQRVILFALAWTLLPGLLDRNLYPLLSTSVFWILGWVLALLPWGLAIGLAPTNSVSWLGFFFAGLLVRFEERIVMDPKFLALAVALLLLPEFLADQPWKKWNRRWAIAALGIIILALSQDSRLNAGPEESILEMGRRLGRILAVVQPSGSQHIQLRDRFHQRALFSEAAPELRRQGLLPFRLHSGSPLRRLLVLGASNPYVASASLELPALARLTWVDPDSTLFALSRWWVSSEAAKNTHTRSERVVSDPVRYLTETRGDSWDSIVLSPATPWSEEGSLLLAPSLPNLVHDRLFSDGLALQWVQIQQWTEPTLFELFRRWNEAFEGRVELWRGDLSPYSPYLAIVARGPTAPQVPDEASLALPDRIVGAVHSSLSLRLTDPRGLKELIASKGNNTSLENAWLMARNRSRGSELLGATWLVQRMSTASSRLGGPSEGGLRYTGASLAWLNGESDWEKDRSKAIELLGFDPTEDSYPNIFPASASGKNPR